MMSAIPLACCRRAAVVKVSSRSPTGGGRRYHRPLSILSSTAVYAETKQQTRHSLFNPCSDSQRLFSTATVDESSTSSASAVGGSSALFDRRNRNATNSKDLEQKKTSRIDILSPALPPLTAEE